MKNKGSSVMGEPEIKVEGPKLKPPFLHDTENGRNSRNRGVENGKWQVSFSEMIQLIFTQNLSQFGRAFNKLLGKVYLLPAFPSKCCFICLLGSYFCSSNALFGSPVWGNVCRAAILFVYTWQSVSRTLQKNSLDFQILIFLFRKMVNFGLFVLFLIENRKTRKMVNLQNGIWIL